MPRRGITVLFTLLGIAVFISAAGLFALYLLVGREPAVSADSTLVLRVGGALTEVAPADVYGYLRGSRGPTVGPAKLAGITIVCAGWEATTSPDTGKS